MSTTSSMSSAISTTAMEQIVLRLKNEQYRSSTRRNYYSVWKSFNAFYLRLDRNPRMWEHRLILFVEYLVQTKKKSTTIHSYVSAIRAVLTEDGRQLKEDKYLLGALTRACKLVNDTIRLRFPIRKNLLNVIL